MKKRQGQGTAISAPPKPKIGFSTLVLETTLTMNDLTPTLYWYCTSEGGNGRKGREDHQGVKEARDKPHLDDRLDFDSIGFLDLR
jgi:hypothetical protein